MAKHGRNQATQSVYGVAERRKDRESEGYGTQKRRAGTASLPAMDCCSLSSAPCSNPVITPNGYLFDKQFILENLLHQKQEFKRKMKEYTAQRAKYDKIQAAKAVEAREKATTDFVLNERSVGQNPTIATPFVQKEKAKSATEIAMAANRNRSFTKDGMAVAKLPAFWLPSLGPETADTEIKPPSSTTMCPMSNTPLRIKDLITVNFTPADKFESKNIFARDERYVCGLTQKVLRNCVPAVVIRPTGAVYTKEAFDLLVKPDMVDPHSGEKLKASDIILMHSAGTGFSGSGAEMKKVRTSAQMVC